MQQAECGFAKPEFLVQFGPTLQVRIGFDPNRRAGTPPALPENDYQALVDTGATASCIDSSLASTLELPIIDRKPVSGVHGLLEVNVHLAQIYIPALGLTQSGAFSGVHLHAGGQPHSVLIGRTFLRFFTMQYHGGTGAVTITRI